MLYCLAYKCDHHDCHSTDGHYCHKCNCYGHGMTECGDELKLKKLKKESSKISIPIKYQCNIPHCEHKNNHTFNGHKCRICKNFGHSHLECTKNIKLQDKIFENHATIAARKIMALTCGKIFVRCYVGMGCMYFCKRDDVDKPIELFFMHSDNWGQYGPETDDRPKLDKFLEGYVMMPGNATIDR